MLNCELKSKIIKACLNWDLKKDGKGSSVKIKAATCQPTAYACFGCTNALHISKIIIFGGKKPFQYKHKSGKRIKVHWQLELKLIELTSKKEEAKPESGRGGGEGESILAQAHYAFVRNSVMFKCTAHLERTAWSV